MKIHDKEIIDTKIWHDGPRNGPIKAVVVLLHGLNLKPQKMDDWSHVLTSHGAEVIRFALYGHSGEKGQMQKVTADLWRAQFRQAMARARIRAHEDGVPLYFIGFSLGALVGLEWLANDNLDEPQIEKMVLIAPALSIPWYSRSAIKALSILGQGFMLPSRSPVEYRANRGTSVAAYEALFTLKTSLEEKRYQNTNLNTLVLMDRNDELVDSRDIRKLIDQFHLSHWILEIVDNRFAYDNFGFRHLMVDESAIGKDLWSVVSLMVLRHFSLKS